MRIEDFKKRIKQAKMTNKETGFLNVRVKTNLDRTRQIIYKEDVCACCGIKNRTGVRVIFNRPRHLTIFEAGLLYALFVQNKKPKDYAGYHRCEAGKEFIENIKEIRVSNE